MEKIKVDMQIDEDEKILSSMKEAYLDCPEAIKYCNEIGIPQNLIDDNITKIYDFVCDKKYCEKCPGIKKCDKNNPLLISKPIFRNGSVSIQMSPCKEMIRQMRFEKQFVIRDCPPRWLEMRLKTFKQDTAGKKYAVKKYVDFLNGIDSGWIYLTGALGNGKSFFGAMIATESATRDIGTVMMLDCAKRFRELVDFSYKKGTDFQDILDQYSKAKVLVLDNFGNEYKTDFIRDSIVYQILSYRYANNLFTIIVSDFSIKEIETMYSTSKAAEIRAKQICTILKNKCGSEINLGEIKIYQ